MYTIKTSNFPLFTKLNHYYSVVASFFHRNYQNILPTREPFPLLNFGTALRKWVGTHA